MTEAKVDVEFVDPVGQRLTRRSRVHRAGEHLLRQRRPVGGQFLRGVDHDEVPVPTLFPQ